MIIGVPKETYPGEQRVALIPATLPSLKKEGMDVQIETGAGAASGYPDDAYAEKGAPLSPPARNSLKLPKSLLRSGCWARIPNKANRTCR